MKGAIDDLQGCTLYAGIVLSIIVRPKKNQELCWNNSAKLKYMKLKKNKTKQNKRKTNETKQNNYITGLSFSKVE